MCVCVYIYIYIYIYIYTPPSFFNNCAICRHIRPSFVQDHAVDLTAWVDCQSGANISIVSKT